MDIETVSVVRFDDFAVEQSSLTIRAGGRVVDQGEALVLWRLVDGQWLYARDMWSSNAPATTASN